MGVPCCTFAQIVSPVLRSRGLAVYWVCHRHTWRDRDAPVDDTLPPMIDIRQINDQYRVGREKTGGKVYVIATTDAHVAAFSGLTKTLEWYQTIDPEEKAVIEAYLKNNY